MCKQPSPVTEFAVITGRQTMMQFGVDGVTSRQRGCEETVFIKRSRIIDPFDRLPASPPITKCHRHITFDRIDCSPSG